MALNLTTRTDYKTYAGISSTNQDTLIDFLIPRVSEFVKNYCKRTFVDYWNSPKTEIFDGGFKNLILAETPIVSISSVQYSADFGQTYTNLAEYTDYVIDGYNIRSTMSSGFPYVLRGYKVIYTGGYEDVPSDLELAILDLITYYLRNDSAIHSAKSVGSNTVQIEYITSASLPIHIRRILDQYVSDYT
jgi:hypothetical protein